MKKKLIVLDIDETLIDSVVDYSTKTYKNSIKVRGNNVLSIFIYKRPGLVKFLNYLFKHYEVALWTAGIDAWLNAVLNNVLKKYKNKFLFTWSRNHLDDNPSYVKSIKRIIANFKQFDYNNIIFIDDNLNAIEPEFNLIHVRIKPFSYKNKDNQLYTLLYLLNKYKNVNHLELIKILNEI